LDLLILVRNLGVGFGLVEGGLSLLSVLLEDVEDGGEGPLVLWVRLRLLDDLQGVSGSPR
jgi:hypothetical protein